MSVKRFTISLSEEVTDTAARQAIQARRPLRWHLEYLVEIAVQSLELKGEPRGESVEVTHAFTG